MTGASSRTDLAATPEPELGPRAWPHGSSFLPTGTAFIKHLPQTQERKD